MRLLIGLLLAMAAPAQSIDCTAENPKCRILHSPDPAQSCGIGFLAFNGVDPGTFATALLNKYAIYTAVMGHEEYTGLRITPNIYTTLKEIDVFAGAVEKELKG